MNPPNIDDTSADAGDSGLEQTAPSLDDAHRHPERTVRDQSPEEATPESYLRRTASDGELEQTRGDEQTPVSFEDSSCVPEEVGGESGLAGERRFVLLDEVGHGATSRVYAVEDRSLSRTVSAKFLRSRGAQKTSVRKRFLREARVTALLEHPNIMPVHDIGTAPDGHLYFTMKRISGGTLGDAIRAAGAGRQVSPEFAALDGRVRIFLKVCDALSYAHSRGFIHQDIKPDNIMLGEFGEVLLLDWGCALTKDEVEQAETRSLMGTPAYMSPEQARRERSDERSDVYCLGATFFHALLLRHPTWDDNAEAFWNKKRAGRIESPTTAERRRTSSALLDIALKAMHPDPSHRYASVDEVAEDLKRYQTGRAVGAHRETPIEAFQRWYRGNRQLFWVGTTGAVLVALVGTILFGEKIKEMLTWRQFAVEDFSDMRTEDLGDDWRGWSAPDWHRARPVVFGGVGPDPWQVEGGRLVGRAAQGFINLSYAHPIPGDMRIEWSATPLKINRDLNCYLAGETRSDGYTFHVGGFGRHDEVTLTKGHTFQSILTAPLDPPLRVGETRRMRMEKEGRWIRFYIDGKKLIEYEDFDILTGPEHRTFGFETNANNAVAIDDIEIYYHPLPRRLSPLVVAHRLYDLGHTRSALASYRETATFYPKTDLAPAARYGVARCLMRLESNEQALAELEWLERQYPRHELMPFAVLDQARLHRLLGDTLAADKALTRLAKRFPGHSVLVMALRDLSSGRETTLRKRVATWSYDPVADPETFAWIERESRTIQEWGRLFDLPLEDNPFLSSAVGVFERRLVLPFDELRRRYPQQRRKLAEVLNRMGNYERVVREFPEQNAAVARALLRMGQYERVLEEYRHVEQYAAEALLELGRSLEVLERYPSQLEAVQTALRRTGRVYEALSRYPTESVELALKVGRPDTLFSLAKRSPSLMAQVLVHAGRPEEALSQLERVPARRQDYHYMLQHYSLLHSLRRREEALRRYADSKGLMQPTFTVALLSLGHYNELRRMFPRNVDARCRLFLETGEFDSLMEDTRCSQLRNEYATALVRSGRLRQVTATFPERLNLKARVLLWRGRYDDVLKHFPEQREECAVALYLLRRYGRVGERFPERRMVCARALLRQGLEAEALQRYPECRPLLGTFLVRQGRYEEVLDKLPVQVMPLSQALVELGRDDEIPFEHGRIRLTRRDAVEIRALQALREHRHGRYGRAYRMCDSLPSADYLWHLERFALFLLEPVLRGLEGDTLAMRAQCRRIQEAHRKHFSQRLFYEAGFLAGDIDSARFMAQPYGFRATDRLTFLRALLADIRGHKARARELYRQFAATPWFTDAAVLSAPEKLTGVNESTRTLADIDASPSVERLVRWREVECGTASGNP